MDRATESNSLFLDAWAVLAKGSPAFESRRGGLIDAAWCGYATPFFNLALTARTPASTSEWAQAAEEMTAWAAERRRPWLFALCHETMGDFRAEAGAVLERLGLAPMMPLTGMEAFGLTPHGRGRPEAAWITEPDESVGPQVIRLNEAAYQMALGEPGSLAMEHPGWWQAPHRMATVVAPGGEPASCAAVINVRGVRYVALVATHPLAQRNGYAEAAMRDVLERSRAAGLERRTYLHASAAGRPVYERMGYQATAEYTVYVKSI